MTGEPAPRSGIAMQQSPMREPATSDDSEDSLDVESPAARPRDRPPRRAPLLRCWRRGCVGDAIVGAVSCMIALAMLIGPAAGFWALHIWWARGDAMARAARDATLGFGACSVANGLLIVLGALVALRVKRADPPLGLAPDACSALGTAGVCLVGWVSAGCGASAIVGASLVQTRSASDLGGPATSARLATVFNTGMLMSSIDTICFCFLACGLVRMGVPEVE